jgi:hypothetical protein
MALTVLVLAAGTTACGGGDTQGRKEADLADVEAQVAQLRLEVQTLRRARRPGESVPTTTTTVPATTTSTVRMTRRVAPPLQER